MRLAPVQTHCKLNIENKLKLHKVKRLKGVKQWLWSLPSLVAYDVSTSLN